MEATVKHHWTTVIIQNGVKQGNFGLFGCTREKRIPREPHYFVYRESSMCESEIHPLFADCVHRPSDLPRRYTWVVIQIVKGVNAKPQLKLRRGILI